MKHIIKVVLLLTGFLLAGCQGSTGSQAGTSAEPIQITACISSPSANQMPFVYAAEGGFFQKHGLEVELITFNSGADAATALVTRDVDICQVAGTSVINAALAGEDLVFIGGLFNRHLYSVITRPEIQSAADLPGQVFAISKPGGLPDSLMRIAADYWGLQVDEDLFLLSVGNQSERLAAMETGAVAGTVLSIPETARARQLGYNIFLDLGALDVFYPSITIASHSAFLAENRPAAIRFLRAVTEAIAEMKQDRDGTLQVMAGYLLLDAQADADLLTEAYDALILGRLESEPFINTSGVQDLIDLTIQENPEWQAINAEQIIDNSLLAEALAVAP
ncbi:MAG: ABC transporter substrate-binding protein [Anaerolineales bacterium]|nr:ABC transporter substrate-binding protein [Anaerolineales bacterium]